MTLPEGKSGPKMSWRRITGTVLVTLPFIGIFVIAAEAHGITEAFGMSAVVICLAAMMVLGVDLMLSDDESEGKQ